MRNAKTLLLASIVSLFQLGCGPLEESSADAVDDSTTVESKIINGTDDSGDPAIVAIFAKLKGKDSGGLCTGTVISPTVVLTAAHCVDPAAFQGEQVESFTVITDWNLTDGIADDARLAVKETHFDPEFNINSVTNGHDVAVVILGEPTAITPIPWNSKPLDTVNKFPIRLVGYGLSDGFNQTGAGVKREAKSKTRSVNTLFVKHGQFLVGSRICNGDSGGPVLANIEGRETVIGVNSFGYAFCLAEAKSTRVDTYSSFVNQWLQP